MYGSSQGILACERLVLNIMQRMSGIAPTPPFKGLISSTKTELLTQEKRHLILECSKKKLFVLVEV